MGKWYDYLSEKAYSEFFEKPAFLAATEPPREESWLTKAYERFRRGAEAAEPEPALTPAMRPSLERFREVERRLQPPARQQPTSARTEFESAAPSASVLQRMLGTYGRGREIAETAMVSPEAPIIEREKPGPREQFAMEFRERLQGKKDTLLTLLDKGRIDEDEAQRRWEQMPQMVINDMAPERKTRLGLKLSDIGLGQFMGRKVTMEDVKEFEKALGLWTITPLFPEELYQPIEKFPVVGEEAAEIARGLTTPIGLAGTALFPEVTGMMVAGELTGYAVGKGIEYGLEKAGLPTTIDVGPLTVGPAGVLQTFGALAAPAAPAVGPAAGRAAVRGARAAPAAGRALRAETERLIPTARQALAEEVGGLKPRPGGALSERLLAAMPDEGFPNTRQGLADLFERVGVKQTEGGKAINELIGTGRIEGAGGKWIRPVREAAPGPTMRPRFRLTNDIRTPAEINKRLGQLSKVEKMTAKQQREWNRLLAEKDLNELRATGTVDDQMDSLLDDIAQMEQELELRAVAREVSPARAPQFGTAERAEWEAARAGRPHGVRPETRFSGEPIEHLRERLKVYKEFREDMKIVPAGEEVAEEALVTRGRFTERGEVIEEPTFATEGELAGVRPRQAELGIGAGERPIETAGPMFERAAAPKPAAQAFREATRRPGAPTREEALGRWRAGYEKPPAAPGEARAGVEPVGRGETLTRWQAGGMGTMEEIEASIGRGLEGRTLGARGAGPPRKPPTAGAAGGIPAESAGNRFVAPLREFDDVVAEVVTSENPVVRALAGRTGINPSILRDTPTGKALTAYWRQRVSGELLAEVAVSPAIDVHAQMFTGRMGGVFRIGTGGEVKNLAIKEGQSRMWQDVFSRPGEYALSTRQRAFVNDYLTVVREVEAMRVGAGLKPRAIMSKEGWFYVPRQVKGIRGVELRRPSNPGLQRVYEEAQEGVAAGIKYSESPRATLEIHVRAAYREVASAQLTEALAPLSITPRELVPRAVVARMEEATRKWVAANREVRRLRVPRVEKAGAVTAEEKALRAKLKFQRGAAAENLEAVKAEYYKAKNVYSRAMESARKAEVAPGNLFGQAEETIPIASWRNRFFPREQADALNEALGSFLRPAQKASPFSRGLEVLGNYIRFLAAVGDFAEPFIQGLPTLVYRPNVWAKSALRHYQAWFDPTVQSRFMRQHLETFQKMAQHGAPIGDPEFFAALTREGGLPLGRLVEILPKGAEARKVLQQGGKQSFGRFQASYNTGLGSNRALLYESLQPTWKGTEGELWQFIKNMTGGLDSRALGVGPSQRGLESVWLAFSPRLLRSTASLIADAARPGTAQGQAAFKALGGLCSVGAGIYVLTGLGLGKSWEEIGAGLNSTQGKRFLSHEINGDWIGIGGQVRAISQFMAHSISALAPGGEPIESFVTTSQFENPILRFYSSRGAPAMNIVGGLVEAGTGLDVLPFDQVDSLPALLKHLGTSALPFAVQGRLEGEQWSTTGAALVGARTSPETVYEKRNKARDEMAQQVFGKPWNELNQGDQDKVRAAEPTLRGLETEATKLGAERGYEYSERTQAYRDKKDEYAAEGERALDSDPTGRAWVGWRKTVGIKLNTTWEMLTERFGIKEEPRERELAEDRLAERYWNLEPDANNDGLVSDEEWAVYDAEREAILGEGRAAGVDEEYIKHGYRGQMWVNHPRLQAIEEQYQQAKEIAHEYLSLPTKIGMSAEEQEELRPLVEEAQGIARMRGLPFESAVLLLDIPERLKTRVMLYRELPDSTARGSWRYANPEEAQLFDTFYGDVPLGMAQGVGVGGGGQSPFWQTVGGYPGTEPQPVAEGQPVGEGQPSSFWQTVAGGVR